MTVAADFDLDELLGIRSFRPSFYDEYRQAEEGWARAIRALQGVSVELSQVTGRPEHLARRLVGQIASDYRNAWIVLWLDLGFFGAEVEAITAAGADGSWVEPGALPEEVSSLVDSACEKWRGRLQSGVEWATIPLVRAGAGVGGLVVWLPCGQKFGARDLTILRAIANQAAIGIENACTFRRSELSYSRARVAAEEAHRQARQLELRSAQIELIERRLFAARQREAIAAERERIARDLHDTVAQYLISIRLHLDWCQRELVDHPEVAKRMGLTRSLAADAIQHIRRAIYALSESEEALRDGVLAPLEELVESVMPLLSAGITLRVLGQRRPLPVDMGQALIGVAREALANVVRHADARRAEVRFEFRGEGVRLTVSDDGRGDPEEVGRLLQIQAGGKGAGRGLHNMRRRMQEVGGRLWISAGSEGGVSVVADLPDQVVPPRP